MLTKYKLIIGSDEYELGEDDLKNWDEIKCLYKRAEYGGVIRSFTSRFEFVNKAYQILMAEFDKRGFHAKATMELYVIDNNWNYNLEYACELDFTTLTYNEYVLSMHAIDDSVASIIKANRSTKFEFVVGEDVPANGVKFLFDRIKMIETATYAITDGTNNEDGSLTGQYTTDKNYRLYVGLTNSELAIGEAIRLNDDQTNGDGYMFSALKSLDITLDYSIIASIEEGCAPLVLMKNEIPIRQLHKGASKKEPWLARDQNSIESVMDYINSDEQRRWSWANESWDEDWITVQGIVWVVKTDVLGSNMWVNTGQTKAEYCAKPEADTITFHLNPRDKVWLKFSSESDRTFKIISSSIKFTWKVKGSPVTMDSIAPDELLERILWKMGVGMDSIISNFNPDISSVLIIPAESIRAIPGAKIYVSFNDFCKWIETVFGYTYVINEEDGIIEFKHRREIFSENTTTIMIDGARDFEYTTEESVLYSSVVVGYDKKEYDSVNGRDEFNFNSSYMTGYNINGKKLELKSPFRADSYGIEFLVEKRGQDTTDNGNDKDVFFVKGVERDGYYQTNRTPDIQNSITGSLINGEFSPIHCVSVNAEYISLMAYSMELKFASTEGNSNIIIDKIGISDDLWLEDCEMLTAGELKFTCADQNIPKDMNCLIRVKSKDFIYEGFIRQVSFILARPETVEYIIMIKTKTPC